VAALVALMFGLGTIGGRTAAFFREPLFTWLGLLAACFIVRARQSFAAGDRPLITLAALALTLAGALLSKEVALLLLPAFVIEALPSRLRAIRPKPRDFLILAGFLVVAGVLAIIVLNADTLFGISNRYAFSERLETARGNISGAATGIAGYMFSPGRSLWIFSPVLLLGFAGWPRLIRQRAGANCSCRW
jgi:hypothetical protein